MERKEDGFAEEEGGGLVVWGAEEGGLVDLAKDEGCHRLLAVGGWIVAAIVGELGADVGIELASLGVVEVVSGLTIVDEGLCDVSDGVLDTSDHDFFAIR